VYENIARKLAQSESFDRAEIQASMQIVHRENQGFSTFEPTGRHLYIYSMEGIEHTVFGKNWSNYGFETSDHLYDSASDLACGSDKVGRALTAAAYISYRLFA
jgi:hypothetical protein